MGGLPVAFPSLSTGVSNNALNAVRLEQALILVSISLQAVLTLSLKVDVADAIAVPFSALRVTSQSDLDNKSFALCLVIFIQIVLSP